MERLIPAAESIKAATSDALHGTACAIAHRLGILKAAPLPAALACCDGGCAPGCQCAKTTASAAMPSLEEAATLQHASEK